MSELKQKSRGWVFTLNNYDEADLARLPTVTCRYLCYGKEVAPGTGTPHLQGYIYFDNARVGTGVKKLVSDRAHLEAQRGSSEECIKYCQKDGEFTEHGERPTQGRRTDLEEAAEQIRTGQMSVDELTWENPRVFHQYGRTLDRLQAISEARRPARDWMTRGLWIYGPTGVGKTHFVQTISSSLYRHTYNDAGWWDRYDGQTVVLLDEFRGQLRFSELLELADRYPHQVPRRGKSPLQFVSKVVAITSDRPPWNVYTKEEQAGMAQLLRRFTLVNMRKRDEVWLERYSSEGQFVDEVKVDLSEIFSDLT